MKPGRPTSHVKAHWITWADQDSTSYYQLDKKGNLAKIEGAYRAHHTSTTKEVKQEKIPPFVYIDDISFAPPVVQLEEEFPVDFAVPAFETNMWHTEISGELMSLLPMDI